MRRAGRIVALVAAGALFAGAARAYLGYRHLYRYGSARTAAANFQEGFSAFEAELKRAVGFSGNPMFHQELGRLYLEMAVAENKFGAPEKRDAYLELARKSLEDLILRNPLDAFGYYELGKVHMLYNFPLLTYAAEGRACLRRALELRPGDEDVNVNGLFAFLLQWPRLSREEKSFVRERLRRNLDAGESFGPRLVRLWADEIGDADRLARILAEDAGIWAKAERLF